MSPHPQLVYPAKPGLDLAAVRRARQPGCKFDYIPVWDNSKQGTGKSTVVQILAGIENFSDQDILMLSAQEQQELIQGVWLFELPELSGLSKTDINKVKSFASRQYDRARPAYGRARVDRPRRCIFIGTTNEPEYLQDPTGNRRFWPVTPTRIDVESVRRDRDQLWAEAAAAESTGEPLIIPEELWPVIAARQSSRMISDPWEDDLTNVEKRAEVPGNLIKVLNDSGNPEYRVRTSYLMHSVLCIPPESSTQAHSRRLGNVMRALDWIGPDNMRFGEGSQGKGYRKPVTVTDTDTGNT
jgi:predicted P-loop ATPase